MVDQKEIPLFKFTYGETNKPIVIMLVLAWGFAVYYATVPDTGIIMLRYFDDYPGLKQIAHFLLFMFGFVLLGPMIIDFFPHSKKQT